jgi:hypothetical protein
VNPRSDSKVESLFPIARTIFSAAVSQVDAVLTAGGDHGQQGDTSVRKLHAGRYLLGAVPATIVGRNQSKNGSRGRSNLSVSVTAGF